MLKKITLFILIIVISILTKGNLYADFDIQFTPIEKSILNNNGLQEMQQYVFKVIPKDKDDALETAHQYNLCLLIGSFFYNDTRFTHFDKMKLKYNDKMKYYTTDTITIPSNSTLFYYQLFENNTKISDLNFLPIVNKMNHFNKGTAEYYVMNSDSSIFLGYFDLERKYH